MATKGQKKVVYRRGGPMRGRLDLIKLKEWMDARLASADADKERAKRVAELETNVSKRARRRMLKRVRPKSGVDPVLERAADKILKEDRIANKKFEKQWRYKQNTKERKEALLNPSETIKKVRTERLLKKMAGEAKPKFRAMDSDRTRMKMVSRNTEAALTARKKAKELGKKAAVDIAKARRLKERKQPITKLATRLNKIARENMDRTKGLRKYLAYDEGMYHVDPQGNKILHGRRASKAQAKKAAAGLPTNPIYDRANRYERSAKIAAQRSKDFARKSGGLATAAKRNAESAIGKIAQAKQYKSVARLGGALGIVGLATQALRGAETKKKKRG